MLIYHFTEIWLKMFNPLKFIQQKIARIMTNWLISDIYPVPQDLLYSFDHLCYDLKPCDVVLVNGRTRVSEVIKIITQSRWSHAAIYIGRLRDITDPELRAKIQQYFSGHEDTQLLVESQMGSGVIVTPLEYYRHEELRICRPSGLNRKDTEKVASYCIQRLGLKYDVRQILDLARFMFPWQYIPLPRQWRTTLFQHNAQDPTMASCSRLLADAFSSVYYPILPEVIIDHLNEVEVVPRNTRLFTPSDFDDSPFFDILKFPRFDLADQSIYQKLKWRNDIVSNDRVGLRENPLFANPAEDESES
ncbi:MAG: hypothetical protein K0S08_1468 [Gammaproteobacteria bacterium]|jgi:hypothetical protein|nr:hypothetical protein [Gammaproteobacteria bacterium]